MENVNEIDFVDCHDNNFGALSWPSRHSCYAVPRCTNGEIAVPMFLGEAFEQNNRKWKIVETVVEDHGNEVPEGEAQLYWLRSDSVHKSHWGGGSGVAGYPRYGGYPWARPNPLK